MSPLSEFVPKLAPVKFLTHLFALLLVKLALTKTLTSLDSVLLIPPPTPWLANLAVLTLVSPTINVSKLHAVLLVNVFVPQELQKLPVLTLVQTVKL